MGIDFLYTSAPGRLLMQVIHRCHLFKVGAFYLNSSISKHMIPGYIRKNGIDMSDFEGQKYNSFGEFFGREKKTEINADKNELISPCDGLLSSYMITDDLIIPMKGSHYSIKDIIPDSQIANMYSGGLCLVFRLRASDYHHLCSFDNMRIKGTYFIEGKLHSVQPIACEHVPVYRLNRRWWSILDTENFGQVIQIEVGAMMVGGFEFAKDEESYTKGEELGKFTLAGSTVILLMTKEISDRISFTQKYTNSLGGDFEQPVIMGEILANKNTGLLHQL